MRRDVDAKGVVALLAWIGVFATVLEILRVNAGPDGANASLVVAAMERRTAEITFMLGIG